MAQALRSTGTVAARSQAGGLLDRARVALARGDLAGAEAALGAMDRPLNAVACIALATIHVERDQPREAAMAYGRALAVAGDDTELVAAALALQEERLDEAEAMLRARLAQWPGDVAARRMLAELGSRLGRYDDAVRLLESCLALYPGFVEARGNLAQVLLRQGLAERALALADELVAAQGGHMGWHLLRAAALVRLGRLDEALGTYRHVLDLRPDQPQAWMSYGHTLKSVCRQAEAVEAYRRAIALAPGLGEAWWSLANLKTWAFDEADRLAMEAALGAPDLSDSDRLHIDFALGKACEDAGQDERAFAHYAAANARRRGQLAYAAARTTHDVDAAIDAARRHLPVAGLSQGGCPASDPIFVVGLPRSGSTLVEQILSSHSQIEGTMELPDIPALAKQVRQRFPGVALAEALDRLGPGERRALGEDYLARTRSQRQTDRPFFIDKMPNNWLHLVLIRLILPNARIIDARRHPMACGWSLFRQHFARGQGFSYDLADIGAYYRDYLRLLGAVDGIEPGRVVRVNHEAMVLDPERGVRDLLAALGLPFEERCLRFWETDRAVRTASSEQVRQPIFTSGLDQWRRFERWLEPLRNALGDAAP